MSSFVLTSSMLNHAPGQSARVLAILANIPVDKPGLSAALHATPYYSCPTQLWVSTTGNDSTGDGSFGNPWLTLAHAEPHGGPGVQINVLPGTYAAGATITHGGNLASSTGYCVYRSVVLGGAIITDPGNQNNAAFDVRANYVIIDGFTLAASSQQTFGQGVQVFNGTNTYVFSQHHVWALNNTISGYGQSGIQMNNGEFFKAVHNVVFNCCQAFNQDSSVQGSGISFASEIPVAGYVLTADDQSDPITGNTGTLFRNFIIWNVAYNNWISPATFAPLFTATNVSLSGTLMTVNGGLTGTVPVAGNGAVLVGTGIPPGTYIASWGTGTGGTGTYNLSHTATTEVGETVTCYTANTDGNGIILDSNNWQFLGTPIPYVNGFLVFGNIVYNNGGGGIHMTQSAYAAIANNTVFNNYLDIYNTGSGRACIDTNSSYGNTIINNICVAYGGAGALSSNSAMGPFGIGTYTTTLNGSISSGVTSLVLASASAMPSGASGQPTATSGYQLPGGNMISIDSETMLVTAGWGTTTLTVQRGYQGTAPASHTNGATVTWVQDYFGNNITLGLNGATDVNGPFNGDQYPASQNKLATNPNLVNVGNTSLGSQSTQPNGTNFALYGASPAIGYGQTPPWLPAQSIDVGAAHHSLSTVP